VPFLQNILWGCFQIKGLILLGGFVSWHEFEVLQQITFVPIKPKLDKYLGPDSAKEPQ